VVGYEGLYEVSDLGAIRRVARQRSDGRGFLKQRKIKPKTGPLGYLHVGLCRDGVVKQKKVHRLVLEAFVGPCPPRSLACHYPDPTPSNCRLANLMWGTHEVNQSHKHEQGTAGISARGESHGSAKLTREQVSMIRNHATNGMQYWKIAGLLGCVISVSQISRIVRGDNWSI
jgi:hypothetical protein